MSGRAPDGGPKLREFEAAVLPHLNAAYNLARWLLRSEPDAEDAVQEAFLRAYRFFDGYRGGDAKAWMLSIVRNTSLSWRRQVRREGARVPFEEEAHAVAAAGPNAEETLAAADDRNALRNCLEALPLEYREALILREFEEMSYRQIAETSGVAIGTVMSRLSRARQRLAQCMGGRRKGAGA